MFEHINTNSGTKHHQDRKHEYNHQFAPDQFEGPLQGFHIGNKAQQFRYSQYTQRPQRLTARQSEKQPGPKRRNGDQVNQSPEAEDIAQLFPAESKTAAPYSMVKMTMITQSKARIGSFQLTGEIRQRLNCHQADGNHDEDDHRIIKGMAVSGIPAPDEITQLLFHRAFKDPHPVDPPPHHKHPVQKAKLVPFRF